MFDEIFDSLTDEVITALKSDLSNPDTVAFLREKFDEAVIRLTGINVNNVFINSYYNSFIDKYQTSILEILGIVVSNPPESIDVTKSFVKNEVTSKLDSFADRLKQKLTTKELSNENA